MTTYNSIYLLYYNMLKNTDMYIYIFILDKRAENSFKNYKIFYNYKVVFSFVSQ